MKKILIISSNRLGDSILSSGLNKFFKDNKSNITLVCGPLPYGLFKFCRNIDKTLLLKKKNIQFIGYFCGQKLFLIFGIVLLILEVVQLVFFYLLEKDSFYKTSVNSEIHKIQSISSLVNKKNLSPNINLELKKKK